MVNKRAPQYLNSLVPPKVSHTYYTRNNLNLQEINCRTSQYQNSFLPKTVHDWNLLSAETKSIESESSFKNKIAPNQVTVPAFYMIGSRGGQILMARLRMNNCGLNDHLYRYGLVDTPTVRADHGKIHGISCFTAHYFIKLEMKLSEVFKINIKH